MKGGKDRRRERKEEETGRGRQGNRKVGGGERNTLNMELVQ